MSEATLARARAGDADAFRELTDPYRRELQAHCYRMLGSLHDAEDLLQDTLLAAWRALAQFEGKSSVRAWLYRIATNRCLNAARAGERRPRIEVSLDAQSRPQAGRLANEPFWLEPYPDRLLNEAVQGPEARYDARESIALSFVVALHRLPPQQRAVLILRDVLGFPSSEVAQTMETTPAAVNSALQRARATLNAQTDPAAVRLPQSPSERAVIERFVVAFERLDIEQVVALLTADARLTMPPEPVEYRGPRSIVEFLMERFWGRLEVLLVPTRANGQPAFGYYLREPNTAVARASGLMVLTLRGDQIAGITRFGDTSLLTRFGLPRTLERDGS